MDRKNLAEIDENLDNPSSEDTLIPLLKLIEQAISYSYDHGYGGVGSKLMELKNLIIIELKKKGTGEETK